MLKMLSELNMIFEKEEELLKVLQENNTIDEPMNNDLQRFRKEEDDLLVKIINDFRRFKRLYGDGIRNRNNRYISLLKSLKEGVKYCEELKVVIDKLMNDIKK